MDSCSLMKYSASDSKLNPYLSSEVINSLNITCGDSIIVSPSGNKIIISTVLEQQYRRLFYKHYFVFNLDNPHTLVTSFKGFSASFCPQNDGDYIAYVDGNRRLLWNRDSGNFEVISVNDGEDIYNGISDFLYNEDVVGREALYAWNAECSAIGYIQLDDSQVPKTQLPEYSPENTNTQYTSYHYPKVGDNNPRATVYIKKSGEAALNYQIKAEQQDKFDYIYDFQWDESNHFLVVGVPRIQDEIHVASMTLGDTANTQYMKLLDCTVASCSYAFYQGFLAFGNQNMLMILPKDDNYHIAYIKDFNSQTLTYVTEGPADVNAIIGLDNAKNVYYQYNTMVESMNQLVKRTNLDNQEEKLYSTESETYKNFEYTSASLSVDGNTLLITHNGPDIPYTLVFTTGDKSEQKYKIELNGHLKDVLKQYTSGMEFNTNIRAERASVGGETNEADIQHLDTLTFYPPEWNGASGNYPVLQYQYGGPGVKIVNCAFTSIYNPWGMYLSTTRGVIYTMVELRGSTRRGIKFAQSQFHQLGVPQLEDSLNYRKYLANRDYVDDKRMGVWGWSFGGFMALTCASTGKFDLALSVAPVTNWAYYDSSYTERYMQTLKENKAGYDKTSIITRLKENPDSFKNTKVLISHGLADTNVHPKNTLDVLAYLQAENIPVDVMLYPNKAHGIAGVHPFLYHKLDEYLTTNFGLTQNIEAARL
eukprot:CAMPEP_0117421412 /NCGR_PEP_ID=MMETSP0758-20121206/2514_1 /TAXON_ID=63605 /ORGANISM="Percolomonas cosmopolitus, Strain AE-1 (ATCC 50343)" /LENGTH=704 /DNA_ID=CAMNT_0005203531 /DNA_START=288 /DNA_END=2400 /DNA_ORIENTATION=+